MFPSIFNCDDNIKKSSYPSDHHQSPNPSFLFNFPSPFLDEHESPLNQIFFQTLHHQTHNMTTTTNDTEIKDSTKRSSKVVVEKETPLRRRSLGVVPRRRTGKKDRHSKICTAQGVRDRRMRLSLQVARKFFDLQDMLGYDKASKTIEWLFTKSKKAIKDLINDHAQANTSETSFLSECESIHDENIIVNNSSTKSSTSKDALIIPKVIKDEMSTKSSTKESREKARARARSRTREKMILEKGQNPNFHQLGFSNSTPLAFEGPYDQTSFQQQLAAEVGTIEKFLGNSSSSSPVSWPTSENSSAADFMGFFGNWDLLNAERSSSIFSVTNQVSLAGNPNDEFP